MTDTPSFDVLVYGASGFTGQLVCEYLHQTYGDQGELRDPSRDSAPSHRR